MLFNSIEFLFFFPAVVLLYFILPFRYRWILLLVASYAFYMSWKVEYVLLILLSTLVDYFAGLKMSDKETRKERRPYMVLSLVSNLGMLFLFKYYNFFFDAVHEILLLANMDYLAPAVSLALPIGISFYTFQTLSYSIDIYKGKITAERHAGYFALYVSYFPQLVAGPIERSANLIPQLKQRFDFDYTRVTNGLKLMAWGFFKKVVVADQVAPMINYVYAQPDEFSGFTIILVSILFAYQVYCDFSGYSDIAIGAAQVMGVRLMENFRRPFFAESLAELWSRWHISLTTWFRDYLFMPLVRDKRIIWPWHYNVAVIYVLSGIWHGANWTFLMWGLVTSIIIIASRSFPKTKGVIYRLSGLQHFPKLDKVVQILITFGIFSLLGIYFRSPTIGMAHAMYSSIFSGWTENFNQIFFNTGPGRSHALYMGYTIFEFALAMFFIVLLEVLQYLQEKKGSLRLILSKKPAFVRWSAYLGITILIILFSFDRQIPFIYFQF